MYADDTQIYVKFNKNCLTSMQMALCQLEHYIADISCWMSQNGLKLNHEKTEWIIFNGNTNLIKDVELHIGLPLKYISKLQLVQNASARVISKTRKRDHITPVLKALHWIPIKKRTQYKMMLLVFNALHKQGPSYISDYLHWHTPSRPLRSMCFPSLTPARSRSVVIQRRILNGGCSQLWNSLPPGLRSTNSFISFNLYSTKHLNN